MQRKNIGLLSGLFLLLLVSGCKKEKEEKPEVDTLSISYKVKTTWPHDVNAFTQGLVIHEGKLYESTGQKQSWIGIVDINTGTSDKKVVLDDKFFGEGITILNNKIYQLTWTSKVGFVYDLKTFKQINEFPLPTKEGWGITHDGTHLIMSDGTDKLTFVDTVSLKTVKTINVTEENSPAKKLNELEYVDGYVYANQWETNRILKIDPKTGKVIGRLDLTSLAQNASLRNPRADVLNGIAYHPTTKLFLVTGKYWPSVYVLQLTQ
ncbi:glutaminyl-peptide cyclotransferase [Chryseosolibacter indicus]|uniref:Glutaminyl-peptide cyclotransferase n=1 Tax=Chryseosolibacter indicus TaxID=2782351 RepID=A0ABS5VMA3_9BACT|nr:glutaminyl-peptide cyclotransferase [Chryseosolibacter indicus]MBT1702501.1 glutaminyl-peptide cyclotransferase [Chryseosolibacter indicus]